MQSLCWDVPVRQFCAGVPSKVTSGYVATIRVDCFDGRQQVPTGSVLSLGSDATTGGGCSPV